MKFLVIALMVWLGQLLAFEPGERMALQMEQGWSGLYNNKFKTSWVVLSDPTNSKGLLDQLNIPEDDKKKFLSIVADSNLSKYRTFNYRIGAKLEVDEKYQELIRQSKEICGIEDSSKRSEVCENYAKKLNNRIKEIIYTNKKDIFEDIEDENFSNNYNYLKQKVSLQKAFVEGFQTYKSIVGMQHNFKRILELNSSLKQKRWLINDSNTLPVTNIEDKFKIDYKKYLVSLVAKDNIAIQYIVADDNNITITYKEHNNSNEEHNNSKQRNINISSQEGSRIIKQIKEFFYIGYDHNQTLIDPFVNEYLSKTMNPTKNQIDTALNFTSFEKDIDTINRYFYRSKVKYILGFTIEDYNSLFKSIIDENYGKIGSAISPTLVKGLGSKLHVTLYRGGFSKARVPFTLKAAAAEYDNLDEQSKVYDSLLDYSGGLLNVRFDLFNLLCNSYDKKTDALLFDSYGASLQVGGKYDLFNKVGENNESNISENYFTPTISLVGQADWNLYNKDDATKKDGYLILGAILTYQYLDKRFEERYGLKDTYLFTVEPFFKIYVNNKLGLKLNYTYVMGMEQRKVLDDRVYLSLDIEP